MLSGGCREVVWRVCGGCLEGVVGCLKGVGQLSGGCEQAVWMVWDGCLEGVGRLSGGCGKVVWRVSH